MPEFCSKLCGGKQGKSLIINCTAFLIYSILPLHVKISILCVIFSVSLGFTLSIIFLYCMMKPLSLNGRGIKSFWISFIHFLYKMFFKKITKLLRDDGKQTRSSSGELIWLSLVLPEVMVQLHMVSDKRLWMNVEGENLVAVFWFIDWFGGYSWWIMISVSHCMDIYMNLSRKALSIKEYDQGDN